VQVLASVTVFTESILEIIVAWFCLILQV
jgi:hypothetical protein